MDPLPDDDVAAAGPTSTRPARRSARSGWGSRTACRTCPSASTGSGAGSGWCQDAEAATTDLLALWPRPGGAPLGVDFCGPDLPIPVPVMRVVPIA